MPPPPPNSVTASSKGDSAPQPQRRPWAAPRLTSWGRGMILGCHNQGPDSHGPLCGSPCTVTNQTLCPGAPNYVGS